LIRDVKLEKNNNWGFAGNGKPSVNLVVKQHLTAENAK